MNVVAGRIQRPWKVRRGPSLLGAITLLLSIFGTIGLSAPARAAAAPAPGVTTLQAPVPSDAGTNPKFYSASATCPATGQCVDVGTYYDGSNKPWGLIETQSGTSWAATEAPEPTGAGTGANQFAEFGSVNCGIETEPCNAVSCPAPSFCVAVGEYMDSSGHFNGMIDTYNGTSWSAVPAAVPANAGTGADINSLLMSVTCSSTTSCIAVGSYENSSAGHEGLVNALSGTSWSAVEAHAPSDAATGSSEVDLLTEISCASATSCVAVGRYRDGSGFQNGMIQTLSGTSWSVIKTPLPANTGTDGGSSLFVDVYSAACTTPTACIIVGDYETSAIRTQALIETLSGTTWTPTQAPEPADQGTGGSLGAALFTVACPIASWCVSVGDYENSSSHNVGLIETFTNGTWTATTSPVPGDAATGVSASSDLQAVSCPTTSYCLASGDYATTAGGFGGMVAVFDPGTWSAASTPVPSNAQSGASLNADPKTVACESPVACVTAGAYIDTSNNHQGFLDTFTGPQGYWMSASDGGIFTFGNLVFYGSTGGIHLNQPIVGMAPTVDNKGYWLVASDGGIFSFGDAVFYGSTGGIHLNKPIVGMATTATGHGYWLVASDGGIFSFGDAVFYGSTGGIVLNKPIVGMASTPSGHGYWLVASDGGIFTFGDATFLGSTGAIHLNKPIVGMASDPNGDGYWLVASDGGIFTFGNAVFYGSTGAIVLNKPIVGMASTPSGHGYWLVASDGGIFSFGDAVFYGSTGAIVLNRPIVGMAT